MPSGAQSSNYISQLRPSLKQTIKENVLCVCRGWGMLLNMQYIIRINNLTSGDEKQ
jgi:hypothetical protein